eukprot:s341_g6.t1
MTHEHSRLILTQLQAAGYRIRWNRTIDASAWTCANRNRWLCMATLMHDPCIDFDRFDMWPISQQHTPCNDMDTILNLPAHVMEKLTIPSDVQSISSKPEYLPLGQRNMTKTDLASVWKSRCFSGHTTLPTFMAMYGSQHALSHDLLKTRGCYAHYYQPEHQAARFWHPTEIAMHHLVWDAISTSTDLKLGWQIVGNQIATPHAALMLVNALNAMPQRHPKIPIEQFFQALWNDRLQAAHVVFNHCDLFDICHHIHCNRFHDTALTHANDLLATIKQGTFHAQVMWSLSQGLFTQDDWLTMSGNRIPHSLPSLISIASQTTEEDDESMTVPFDPMLAGKVIHNTFESTFWFQHHFALPDFTHLWSQDPEIATCHARWLTTAETAESARAVEIRPCQEDMHDITDGTTQVVAFVRDGQLSLYRTPPGQNFGKCLDEWHMQEPLHDQFGALPMDQQPHGAMLPPSEFQYSPFHMPAIVLSAFQALTDFRTHWDLAPGQFDIQGSGCRSTAATMSEFWSTLIPCERLMHMGLKAQADREAEHFKVSFIPTGRTCPMPPNQFWVLVATAAARKMLDGFRDDDEIPVQIKWISRPLWSGSIAATTTMEQIEGVLKWTLQVSMGEAKPRIIANGRQHFNTSIRELVQQSNASTVKCHVVASLHGGGAKDLNRTQVKNSIAATLLETGYALSQVTEIVEAVAQTKTAPPVPTDYAIVPGFLCNQDDTEVQQIPQITSACTGVCLIDPEHAKPWLRENQLISKDELALFIIATQPPETQLEVQQILMPCTNRQDQQVIISGYLVQLGAKQVKVKEITTQQVSMKECTVAALTVWKDEWNDQEWSGFLKQTAATFRKALGEDGNEEAIPSLWGRSVRAKGKPAADTSAESIQIHCTVSHDALDRILARSGFCKVYITPKADTARSSDAYRIIWLKGDLAHITAQATKTNSCAGLIRGRQSLGLRYAKTHFQAAWTILCPNQTMPDMNGGTKAYKLSPLPFGCPASAARSIQGPIEIQFQQQEHRITELEKTIKVIAQNQEDLKVLKVSSDRNFREVAQRDVQTREYVATSMDQIRKDLQTSLTHAMEKQTADLSSNMEDLKKLFRAHAKRPRKEDKEDEEMEDED